jgi:hypothetical protein
VTTKARRESRRTPRSSQQRTRRHSMDAATRTEAPDQQPMQAPCPCTRTLPRSSAFTASRTDEARRVPLPDHPASTRDWYRFPGEGFEAAGWGGLKVAFLARDDDALDVHQATVTAGCDRRQVSKRAGLLGASVRAARLAHERSGNNALAATAISSYRSGR